MWGVWISTLWISFSKRLLLLLLLRALPLVAMTAHGRGCANEGRGEGQRECAKATTTHTPRHTAAKANREKKGLAQRKKTSCQPFWASPTQKDLKGHKQQL